MATLKLAYPVFYSRLKPQDIEATVKLWTRMFADDPYEAVTIALEMLISKHSGYPPDIAALRKQIDEMTLVAVGEPTDEELWHLLQKAASNGYYGYQQEYEKLPPILKRYLGIADTLREFAQMEESVFNTVVKGQFLKQIGVLRQRAKDAQGMPDAVKQLFAASYKRLPEERAQLTGEEINNRRNRLLDRIEESRGEKNVKFKSE